MYTKTMLHKYFANIILTISICLLVGCVRFHEHFLFEYKIENTSCATIKLIDLYGEADQGRLENAGEVSNCSKYTQYLLRYTGECYNASNYLSLIQEHNACLARIVVPKGFCALKPKDIIDEADFSSELVIKLLLKANSLNSTIKLLSKKKITPQNKDQIEEMIVKECTGK